MLPIRLVMTRTPLQNGAFHEQLDNAAVYIDHIKVDTVTEISDGRRREQAIPGRANSVIRYVDHQVGYRLIYAEETAAQIARMRFRLMHGEDPQTPDFSGIPSGI